ncbi:EamA-like transporter family protein [Clostridium amylolyticum]|uniref:EamA-like transporter family protein n=1 Tax=Clostridium amylolyticum TaxID=1121298 RepID=A0A1M6GFU2_9CLOT|nr:EamA family transporter [Clostridium amylolyticum]SHJ08789.1 EamA-like transporter family protein [Clostridium amylolyticum]
MINKHILIMMISVLVAAISQILLKISANKEHKNIINEYLNPHVILGYVLLFASTILTILALRGMELKNLPIIEASGYIYVLIFSALVLKEKITKKKIIGNIIIILGIIVFFGKW